MSGGGFEVFTGKGGEARPRAPKMQFPGHSFRISLVAPYVRRWDCECGAAFGQQPDVSGRAGRAAHRQHKAALLAVASEWMAPDRP